MSAIPPLFPGAPRYNDAYFMLGALGPLPAVMTYVQERVEVVHGPACRPEQEVELERCAADGVPVLQRRGGGGTVVLAPGMVITVVVGRRLRDESIHDVHHRVHHPLAGILSAITTAPVVQEGISDLAIGGRKVLGSSLYLGREPFLFYYQSSLMVDPDLDLLSRYLRHPPREPAYRAGRSHAEFCTSLRRQGCRLGAREVAARIGEELGTGMGNGVRAVSA